MEPNSELMQILHRRRAVIGESLPEAARAGNRSSCTAAPAGPQKPEPVATKAGAASLTTVSLATSASEELLQKLQHRRTLMGERLQRQPLREIETPGRPRTPPALRVEPSAVNLDISKACNASRRDAHVAAASRESKGHYQQQQSVWVSPREFVEAAGTSKRQDRVNGPDQEASWTTHDELAAVPASMADWTLHREAATEPLRVAAWSEPPDPAGTEHEQGITAQLREANWSEPHDPAPLPEAAVGRSEVPNLQQAAACSLSQGPASVPGGAAGLHASVAIKTADGGQHQEAAISPLRVAWDAAAPPPPKTAQWHEFDLPAIDPLNAAVWGVRQEPVPVSIQTPDQHQWQATTPLPALSSVQPCVAKRSTFFSWSSPVQDYLNNTDAQPGTGRTGHRDPDKSFAEVSPSSQLTVVESPGTQPETMEPLEYMILPYLHELPPELIVRLKNMAEVHDGLVNRLRSENMRLRRNPNQGVEDTDHVADAEMGDKLVGQASSASGSPGTELQSPKDHLTSATGSSDTEHHLQPHSPASEHGSAITEFYPQTDPPLSASSSSDTELHPQSESPASGISSSDTELHPKSDHSVSPSGSSCADLKRTLAQQARIKMRDRSGEVQATELDVAHPSPPTAAPAKGKVVRVSPADTKIDRAKVGVQRRVATISKNALALEEDCKAHAAQVELACNRARRKSLRTEAQACLKAAQRRLRIAREEAKMCAGASSLRGAYGDENCSAERLNRCPSGSTSHRDAKGSPLSVQRSWELAKKEMGATSSCLANLEGAVRATTQALQARARRL